MLRITGDVGKLLELARITQSEFELQEVLKSLNVYGEHHRSCICIDATIHAVDIPRRDCEVLLKFILQDDGEEHVTYGGLNIRMVGEEQYDWSTNQ